MSNEHGIGKLIEGDEGTDTENRDAVHMAIIPVMAGELLISGDHVAIVQRSDRYEAFNDESPVGIVDPFLTDRLGARLVIGKGERFWLFLYPGSISGLRHYWWHPTFGETDDRTKWKKVDDEENDEDDDGGDGCGEGCG